MAKRGKRIREKAFSVAMAAMLAFSMTPTAAFAAGSGTDDPFENAKAPAQAQEQSASPTASEGVPPSMPAQSASSGDATQLVAAPMPAEEPEHVKIAFDANAKDATGEMDDFEVVLDGKQRKLPACAFEREGYGFAGWSTTADGEDVKDDPDTRDVDESFKASFVSEGQKLEDLGYSYEKEGADGKVETVNADLTYAVKDGKVTLYAQWKELPKPEEAAAESSEVVTKPDESASKLDEAMAPKDVPADSAKGEDGDVSKDAPADTTQKPSDTPAKPDAEAKQAEPEATAVVDGELLGVTVSDATDEGAAEGALEEAGLEAPVARQAARQLFAAPAKAAAASDDMPWEADGSSVTALDAKWITEDTVDNGDASLLYLKPSDDELQEARIRISYSMSGEKDYEPGDVVITIPASMFVDRDGNVIGKLVVPYPEEPGTKGAFNWKQVGDTVQIVNTKRMKAATQGFLDIAFTELTPHVIKDMQRHRWAGATIEVTTWAGNVIGKKSGTLRCEIDTAAEVQSASKERSGTIDVVTAASVPDSAKVEGENEYVRVHWYTWAYVNANQTFDLDYVDTVTDAYESATDGHDGDNAKVKSGEVYSRTCMNGRTRYDHFYVYYPFSQFEPDTDYTFKNSVTYMLTETDPEVGSDPRQATSQTATAQAIWNYHLPEFKVPTGHFMVYKMGNDGDTWGGKQNASHKDWEAHRLNWSERPDYITNYKSYWYGVYPNALNKLRQGEDVEIGYTSQAVGYLLPWTLAEGADAKLAESYNQRSVTMTVEEDGLDNLTVGEDYNWTAVDFGIDPWIAKLKAINVNPDGTITAVSAGDGTFEYETDYDKSKIPQIVLSIERNGEWEDYATVDYTSGTCMATLADGTAVEGTKVPLPEHVTDLRVSATTNVAALIYRFRPMATLHAGSEKVQAITDFAFANGRVPTYIQYNQLHMTAERTDTHGEIVRLEDYRGYDQLMGYTTDVSIVPSKSSVQGISDIDYDEGTVKVHYAAVAEERTTITDLGTYKQALEDGAILQETHGVWRDLLPKGMVPDVASVRLRSGDKVERAYTLEDYEGSGRTLLVVEATLQNAPQQYTDKGLKYWEDVPSIRFDATYSLENVINYGDELHNVISFESGNPSIGTVRDYSGEPDDPRSSNNVATRNAFADDAERDAMTDLDKSSDKPAFVYAGTWTNLDLLGRGTTSLSKEVDVNNEGTFTTGVHYGHPEEYPAGEARTVYEGGQYTYRLTMMSNVGTTSKDMILYDTLENFHAGQGNDEVDINAPRWQGTLRKVDVSQLEAIGVAPVVYYATEAEMPLEDADEHEVNSLETASEKWVRADAYTGSMSDVKAVAIDLRKKADGSDFELPEGESVVVLVQMKAPWGDEVRDYIADDAHAYNNAFLKATSVDNETFAEDTKWIRKDYVKVGIAEMNIDVEKKWEDDGNRDGVRPESVTMHLYAGDVDTGRTVVLDEGNGWKAAFEHVPYTDEDGEKVIYSVREDVPGGYESSVDLVGTQAVVTNSHDMEKVHLSGEKRWVGDDGVEGARPQSILVTLYADGKRVADRTVHDEGGTWRYDFGELPKYRDGGTEIVYTVSELRTKALESYTMEADGLDVVNTYHPYGDLAVVKHVTGATPSVAGKRFAFTFSFADGDGEPLFDEFDYDVVDADGNVIAGRSGKVKTDGMVELADGETAVVHEIPQGTTYMVAETVYDGWTMTRKSGDVGTVKPNDTVEATFWNSYKTEGMAQLQATKSLTGHDMMRYQFRFEVYDVTGLTGAERETGGELVRAGSNAADGTVTFGALRYGNADDGKTYTYRVQETDRGKPGYTYDSHVAYVDVAVGDDGDGTMTVTPTTEGGVETVYVPATVDEAVSGDVELFGLVGDTYKALVHRSVDGTETWGYMSGSEFSPYDLTKGVFKAVERTALHFENAYYAEGSVDLKCWKQLEGRNLADGEFSFELVELDKDDNVVEGGVHQVKRNDANGEVAWDTVTYDQDDAGKTFYYRMTEVAGDDATVTYDGSSKIMSVTVVDNGDGTLSCSTGTAKLVPHAKDGADLTVRGIAQVCSHLNDDDNYLTIVSNPPISNDLRWADAGLYNSGYYSDAQRKFEVASSQSDVDLFDTIWDMDYFPKVNKTWTGEDAMTVLSTLAKHFNGGNEPESALKFIDTDAVYKTNWYDTLGSNGEWENIWTRAHAYKAYGFGFDAVDPNGADSAGVYCCSYMFKVDASELTYTVETTEAEVPIFKNTLKPGDLVVQKRVTDDSTGYPEDQTFKFRVELGDPSTETVDGMVEATKVSHTNNMGDDGVATRMLNGYETKTDTVTFPGSEQLKVDVWFSTYSDYYAWLAIYGADQTPTTSNYNDAAVSQGKLGGGASYNSYARPTSASCHRTYTVDGDTVKFYFRCNGSGSSYCSGYGYYATVTGMVPGEVEAPTGGSVEIDPDAIEFSSIPTAMVTPIDLGGAWESFCGFLDDVNPFKVEKAYAVTPGWSKIGTCEWKITDGELVIRPENGAAEGTLTSDRPWTDNSVKDSVTSVRFEGTVHADPNCTNYFANMKAMTRFDGKGFDTSNVTNMNSMFQYCDRLSVVDLSSWDTSNVTNMSYMFGSCKNLKSLDVSGFDTSSVTNMYCMFFYCLRIEHLDVSNFDTSKVTNMGMMFRSCPSLESVNVSGWDTSNVEDMQYMFSGCKKIESLDLSSFKTPNMRIMGNMFYDCSNLAVLDVSGFDFSNGSLSTSGMFSNCPKLSTVRLGEKFKFLYSSTWGYQNNLPDPPSGTTTGKWMMEGGGYGPLTSGELASSYTAEMAGTWKWEPKEPASGDDIASGTYDGVDWRITANYELIIGKEGQTQTFVERDYRSASDWPWWRYLSVMRSVRFEGNVVGAGSMDSMFQDASALISVDMSGFDASNVTSMRSMFNGCKNLASLDLGDKFDTSKVTNMNQMFRYCSALASLDLGDKFDTSEVTNMSYMFYDCSGLHSLDVSGFDTSKVQNMNSMFYDCRNLTSLDVSGFDTAETLDMGSMFRNCDGLTYLDVSSFDGSKVSITNSMFYSDNSTGIKMIKLGKNFKFKSSYGSGLNNAGTWVRIESPDMAVSADELESGYGPDWAGTWVWSGLDGLTTVTYDGNGGFVPGEQSEVLFGDDVSVTLRDDVTRPGFELVGWTEERDGGGERLQPGSEYEPAKGAVTVLYAQWAKDNYVGYTVRNHVEKPDGSGYDLADTIVYERKGAPGDTVTVKPREREGMVTPDAQDVTLVADGSTTVDFYYDRERYNVLFDPNGADLGRMDPLEMVGGIAQAMPENMFSWLGHVFLGWNTRADGTGVDYADGERVLSFPFGSGDVNLFAKWTEGVEAPASTTGEYTVHLKGGQSVEFVGLPHGTEYEITEVDVPIGWEQAGSEGTTGTVVVNETQQATVTNRYSAEGEATVKVRKSFEGGKLDEGAFSFELVGEDGVVVSRASNGAPGPDGIATVEFDPIQYDAEGVYRYTVREVKGADARVDYDESTVGVTVLVKDAGHGNLATMVEYEGDDDLFENRIGTGKLKVSKATEDATDVSADRKFTFDVELADADGKPLDGEAYKLSGEVLATGETDSSAEARAASQGAKVTFDANGGAFSGQHDVNVVNVDGTELEGIWHTDNIGDDGVKVEDFQSNHNYTGIVTVPGAESLTLDFDYTNVRGSFYVWEGAHPEVATPTYSTDFNPNTAALSVGYTGSNDDNIVLHGSRTISGDTFTVLYSCYAYPSNSCPPNNGGYNELTNYGCFIRAHCGARVVTGTYEEPAGALGMRFAGWYTDEACTEGHEFDFESYDSANGDVTVYAKWVPYEGTVDAGHVTFELQGGQSATLAGLPDGTTYKVTERDVPSGWEQVASDGATGSVEVAKTAPATVTNRYSTSGVWTPKATKSLAGADLEDGQYAFELVDGSGTAVTTGTNAADGTVTFGPVLYTGADHGKTYEYTMREVAGEEGNTAYDPHEAQVIVKPVDNGDGTMTVMASYDGGTTFDGEVGAVPPEFSNEKLPDVKSVAVAKSWKEHGQTVPWPEGVEVTAVLYADGAEVSRATLTAEAPTATFSNLPVKDGERDIVYTVDEVVPQDAQWEKASVASAGSDGSLDKWVIVNNAYAPVDMPLTGGEGLALGLVLALMAAGAIGFAATRRKRAGAEEAI